MAARALTAAVFFGGRRAGGLRTGARATASATGAQVEAALNRKDVEELVDLNPQGEETVVAVVGGGGAPDAGEWAPDGDTGVFVPADAGTPVTPVNGGSSASVLDQAVFVREEDMEDVERPAIDMPNASPNANGGSSN